MTGGIPGDYLFPLILSRNLPEHLKVTTLLSASIKSSPVWGFLPLRLLLSFTENFPNPVIKTSSPSSRVFLMIASRDSTTCVDLVLGRSTCLQMEFIIWALVSVTSWCSSCWVKTLIFYGGYTHLESILLLHGHFVKELWML